VAEAVGIPISVSKVPVAASYAEETKLLKLHDLINIRPLIARLTNEFVDLPVRCRR
jgi:hypothetical protein